MMKLISTYMYLYNSYRMNGVTLLLEVVMFLKNSLIQVLIGYLIGCGRMSLHFLLYQSLLNMQKSLVNILMGSKTYLTVKNLTGTFG